MKRSRAPIRDEDSEMERPRPTRSRGGLGLGSGAGRHASHDRMATGQRRGGLNPISTSATGTSVVVKSQIIGQAHIFSLQSTPG